MKIPVATNERGDRRAKPQTPWPLVQPEPSRAPKPTSRPEATSVSHEASKAGGALLHRARATSGDRTRPTISDQRQRRVGVADLERAADNARRAHDAAEAEDQQRRRQPDDQRRRQAPTAA